MLNVPRLRLLSELHRLGTLAAVARSLSYSPSAVSQQLALLEKEAGVPLLERSGRRVRLTDAALDLVGHADAVVERLERAEAELADARSEVAGDLRVASFQSPLLTIVPAAITLLAERHPALRVSVAQRELPQALEGLASHEFDVIVGEEFPGVHQALRPGADREELIADPLLLVLPATGRFAGLERVEQLADAAWVLEPQASVTGIWQRSALRAAGIEPDVRFETPDPLVQAHMVRSGHAASLIPALIAAEHLEGTRLLRLPDDPHRRIYTSVRCGRSGHPAIRAVRCALADAAAACARPAPPPVMPV